MRVYTAFAVFFLVLPVCVVNAQDRRCEDWTAVVTVAEGVVEIERRGETGWRPAAQGTIVCQGDRLHTREFGMALLRLPDQTSVQLDADAVLAFGAPEDDSRTWLEIIRGWIQVISRNPRDLKVITSYVNAGLEGTEFAIGVEGTRFELVVGEGEVVLDNGSEQLSVSSMRRVSAEAGVYGAVQAADREPLAWTIDYPRIVGGDLPRPDQAVPADGDEAEFRVRRAQSRLLVGSVVEAEADLAAARALRPGLAEAPALAAVIELAQGRVEAADALIRDALLSDPGSAAGLLARSHWLGGQRELRRAHALLAELAVQRPDNALAAARLAELSFGIGDFDAARSEAERALDLDPDVALAHLVLGFLDLPAGAIDAAEAAFAEAARLDPGSPLAHFGLGQVDIRRRRLERGREQLENAVALASNSALLRAYMARTYGEEGRDTLVDSQLGIAKELDADGFTPWVYEAVVAQTENRPIIAVRNLDRAAALNGNESVFRSGLYLDEDLGARNADYGEMYSAAGYDKGALLSGTHAVTANPGDFTGHQLLANVAETKPRHQIARVDAAYQAQLRRPLESQPLAPERFETAISLMGVAGPAPPIRPASRSTYFQNGVKARVSGIAGDRATSGRQAIISALTDGMFVNAGYFGFDTDGFRENNDFEHEVATMLVQWRPEIDASYQVEVRSAHSAYGDVRLLFDPLNFARNVRQRDDVDSLRFGMSRRVSAATTVLAALQADRGSFEFHAPVVDGLAETSTRIGELQFLTERPGWNLTYGIRHTRTESDDSFRMLVPGTDMGITRAASTRPSHALGYAYANWNIRPRLYLTLGASVDRLEGGIVEGTFFNQKLGLIWRPASTTYVRAAAFRTTQGSVASRQLIRPSLEPTHVAGFGQYLFAPVGERADHYGIGVDHALTPTLRLGAEYRVRDVTFPTVFQAPRSLPLIERNSIRESIADGLVYWTPSSTLALNFGYEYERFDHRDARQLAEAYGYVRTRRAPISLTLFPGRAFRAELTGTHVRQSGEFELGAPGPSQTVGTAASEFVVYDLALSYRLPNRRGSLELVVKNLLDDAFRYQNTDPYNPEILPERFAMARFSLTF